MDGYNIIFAWPDLQEQAHHSLEDARKSLIDILSNFHGFHSGELILVFDAYKVPRGTGSAEAYRNIIIVYTRQAQTADAFIEQTTYLARGTGRVRVVTSDQPEQLIATGNNALRTSSREFRREVIRVQGSIAAFLERNNRPGTEKALERAWKEAWKKHQVEKHGESR